MLSLSKGGSLNLSKESDGLTHIFLGMGWAIKDKNSKETYTEEVPVKSIGNLFRSIFGGTLVTKTVTRTRKGPTSPYEYDLDASCALINLDGRCNNSDLIYFNHKNHSSGAVAHGGDNLTGSDGNKDDEVIDVRLDKVPSNINTIVFFMNIYQASTRKQSFKDLTKAYIRIVNADGNAELCRYDLTDLSPNDTALILGKLERQNSEWVFTAVGESLTADYPSEVVGNLKKFINNKR